VLGELENSNLKSIEDWDEDIVSVAVGGEFQGLKCFAKVNKG
jgi:hypothetical protein